MIVRKFWQLIIVIVISIGLLSCAVSSHAETWWNKGSHANPQVARIINKSNNPLIISSNYSLNIGDLMSLSHLLNKSVKMQLVIEPNIPDIPNNFSNVFLFNPSQKFKSKMEQKYNLKMIYQRGRLWKLGHKNT